ncbi:RNA polymerase sigma factor [Oceanibacterium hippocampi]|uniref:RNA polymerase sigma factor n=1 Tax=Oceanibacterium hippocampi TaxID=745714 RepID=A0A1Y5SZ82_9PROT|nr:RNA polymerase sigma factor [Oceanibacterium hippocampi]SLN48456.1 ECF RNA polymerase sigma factor SigW [Oceanibacterium hippocampi]
MIQIQGNAALAVDSDRVQADRIGRGDVDAFERVMRDNNSRLFRVVRAMVPDDSEAEDIVQETYVRAYQHIMDFRGEASLSSWLVRIAINETHDRRRRSRPTVELDEISNVRPMDILRGDSTCGAGQASPEAAVARAQIRRCLERAIGNLPAGMRDVFALRALEEYSVQEVAELLGIRPEAVKTRYHRAKALLQSAIDEEIHQSLKEAFPFGGRTCDRVVAATLARLGLADDR